jgi:hypothetical protein
VRQLYLTGLVASLFGLILSLVAHLRSIAGFGFHHWFAPFGLIFALFVPYILACDGIVHGGATGWRKDPREYLGPRTGRASWLGLNFFERQYRWRTGFARRPPWMNRLDLLVNVYCLITFIVLFFIKGQRGELSNIFSSTALPSSIVFVISSGWVLCFWVFFSTFWLVMQINAES